MSKQLNNDEIWFWYEKIENQKTSGLSAAEYCQSLKIDYQKFCNMKYKIEYRKYSNPVLYDKLIKIGRQYLMERAKSGIGANTFAKNYNIKIRMLGEVTTHLNYLEKIEEMQSSMKEETMSFVQVPQKLIISNPPVEEESEIIEKQNDLEIIISKGVKVSISANLDVMKVIKIIELLKDL